MATIVGSVSIRVLPDTTAFAPSLEKYLRRIESRTRLDIPLDIDSAGVGAQIQALRQRAEANDITLPTDADTTGASASIAAFLARHRLHDLSIGVNIDRNTITRASTALLGLVGSLARVGASTLKIGAIVASIGGLGGAALAAGGAIGQLSGALGVLPAMGAAAAVGIATLVVGFQGFGEALTNLGDPEKFAEAIAKLAPAARETATAIRDLAPAFSALRLDVQQTLFAGMGSTIQDVATSYLPVLRTGMTGLATAFGGMAKEIAGFLTNTQTMADFGTLFANTTTSVGILGGALRDVLYAFRDIGTVGSAFLPGLSTGAANAAASFRTFIAQARETGKLAEWIQTGLDAFRQLGQIIGNVGSILGSLFNAANLSGASFLDTLSAVTGSLASFFSSAQGMGALTHVFAGVRAALGGIMDLLAPLQNAFVAIAPAAQQLGVALGGAFASLAPAIAPVAAALAALAPAVGGIAQVFATVLSTALQTVAPLLASLAPVFLQIATAVGGVLMQAMNALAPILPVITGLFAQFGGILASALTAAAPLLSQIVSLLATGLTQALAVLMPVLPPLVNAFMGIVQALMPVIPLFAQLVSALLPPLAGLITQIFTAFAPLITQIVQIASAVLPPLIGAFMQVIGAIQPLLPIVADLIGALLPPLMNLLNAILPIIGPLATLFLQLVAAVVPILQPIAQLIGALLPPLISLLTGVLTPIINMASAFLGQAVPAIRAVIGVVSDVIGWFGQMLTGVVNAVNGVLQWFGNLGSSIIGALADAGSWLIETGANIIRGLLQGLANMAGAVGDFLIGLVKDAVGGVLDFLGIGSPSRYMAKIGKWTAQGMALGIDDGTPQAVKSAQKLANGVAITPQMNATYGAVSSMSRPESVRDALAGMAIEVNAGQVTRWVDRQHVANVGR